jgi:membrane-associated phospholipid phosphatase
MKKFRTKIVLAVITAVASTATPARADEVIEWNQIMIDASLAEHTAPFVLTRSAAVVQAAVFDALNAIQSRYQPVHVRVGAPPGVSRRAAVVQAAYATLVSVFPTQRALLDAKRWASLEKIANDERCTRCNAIERGIDWGQQVADEILAWRGGDGFITFYPPFLGGSAPGQWRPTPPAFVPGVGVVFANMTPWVLDSPWQYRPDGPPALTSAQYAAGVNESKTAGSAYSLIRTADQTLFAKFWNADTVTYFWDRVAASLCTRHRSTMLENARMFAQLNLAMADAVIATWDAKYSYASWRPVTAIPLAGTDGNRETTPQPDWTPLLVTPAHPEFPSAHSTISAAAVTVLASFFGEHTRFTVDSSAFPGVTRTFQNFSAALEEVADARVFGGIHFRAACEAGQALGRKTGTYVLRHSCRPLHHRRSGEIDFEGDPE